VCCLLGLGVVGLREGGGGGGGVLGLICAGYVPLASLSPYPIIVFSVANYRPHLSHFWANVSFLRSLPAVHISPLLLIIIRKYSRVSN